VRVEIPWGISARRCLSFGLFCKSPLSGPCTPAVRLSFPVTLSAWLLPLTLTQHHPSGCSCPPSGHGGLSLSFSQLHLPALWATTLSSMHHSVSPILAFSYQSQTSASPTSHVCFRRALSSQTPSPSATSRCHLCSNQTLQRRLWQHGIACLEWTCQCNR